MTPAQWRQWRARVYASVLTGDQKVIVLALAEFAGFQSGRDARPGVDRLATMCRLKERAVRNALQVAEAQGLIAKTGTANGQRGVCNVYRVTTTGTTVPPVDDNHRHDGAASDDETTGTVVPNHRHGDDQTTGTVVPPTYVRPTQDQRKTPPTPPSLERSPAHGAASADESSSRQLPDPANEAREQNGEPEPVDAEIVSEERGQERGRSDPVHHSAARLVSTLVPAGFPAAFKTGLRLAASQLIVGDGIASEVVAEAIRRLLARPDAGVGLLPHIAAQVLREGTAPPPRSKIGDWARFTEELRAAEGQQTPGAAWAPTSKIRTVARMAAEARAAEVRAAEEAGREPAPPPLAIEAKAAPAPELRPRLPESVRGPNGEPRCRRHAYLPHRPPSCQACARLAADEAGEAS